MIISSWNVNSVRARIENIKEYLKKFSPDIVMIQEIKTEDINFPYDEFKTLEYESYVFGQKNNGMRIDHFLVSNSLLNIIKDVKINKYPRGKEKPSDHTPIEIELA